MSPARGPYSDLADLSYILGAIALCILVVWIIRKRGWMPDFGTSLGKSMSDGLARTVGPRMDRFEEKLDRVEQGQVASEAVARQSLALQRKIADQQGVRYEMLSAEGTSRHRVTELPEAPRTGRPSPG